MSACTTVSLVEALGMVALSVGCVLWGAAQLGPIVAGAAGLTAWMAGQHQDMDLEEEFDS
jgi:hypothetical protein